MAAIGRTPTAAASAATIGSHAIGPVQIKAAAGTGIGHHGSVENKASDERSGRALHAGINAASAKLAKKTHHGAGTTSRSRAESAEATATLPAAHQAEKAMTNGPTARRTGGS